jgi:hypothetical protein
LSENGKLAHMSHGEYLNSQPLDISVVKNLQVDSIDNKTSVLSRTFR